MHLGLIFPALCVILVLLVVVDCRACGRDWGD
jgi:hypothetical protein